MSRPDCLTCELVARRDRGEAPLWDSIHRTEHYDVVHALNSFLPGWMVIVPRRHIESIAEMTSAEAAVLGPLIHQVSQALHDVVCCEKTYVMQFAEAVGHSHVHFHVVPRMADIPDTHKGGNVFAYMGADEASRVPEDEMNRIGMAIRPFLAR